MDYTIFTYGTLMKGQRNHHYLRGCRFLCDGLLEGYGLFDTPYDYPAAVRMDDQAVYGELYVADEKAKEMMDELEDVGELYDCVKVKVKTEEGYKDALFYEYLRSTEGLKPYTGKGKWVCIKDRKII